MFFGGYGGLCETCSEEETRHTGNPGRDEWLDENLEKENLEFLNLELRKFVEVIR